MKYFLTTWNISLHTKDDNDIIKEVERLVKEGRTKSRAVRELIRTAIKEKKENEVCSCK